MALQTSGAISLSEIQTEFGGSNPISISEYYGSGGVTGSGEISLTDFYGTSNRVVINLTTGATNNYNIYNNRGGTYSAGSSDIILTVNGRVGSTSTATPAIDTGVFASGDTSFND